MLPFLLQQLFLGWYNKYFKSDTLRGSSILLGQGAHFVLSEVDVTYSKFLFQLAARFPELLKYLSALGSGVRC